MKNVCIRALAVMMVFIITLCTLPATSVASTTENSSQDLTQFKESPSPAALKFDFILPNESYMESAQISEIVTRREENVKHFLLPDGTVHAIVYSEPIHRKDSRGNWENYNNALCLTKANSKEIYTTADSRLSFSKNANQGQPIFTLAESGFKVSLQFANTPTQQKLSESSAAKTATVITDITPAKEYWPTLEEAIHSAYSSTSVKYIDAYYGTDVEYVMRGSSIKENIIVKERLSNYSYSFTLSLVGLEAILEKNGSISLHDSDGITRYTLPAPYMYDNENTLSRNVQYALEKIGSGIYTITVTADTEWINAKERVFPITIDPTINVSSGIVDTFVNKADKNTNYGNWSVWVDQTYTGLIKFPLPQLPPNSTIKLAHLCMYYYYYSGVSGARSIGAYRMDAAWAENTVTYQSLYSQYGTSLGSSTTPLTTVTATATPTPTKLTINLLSAVQAWYNGTPNNGIALKSVSENLTSTDTSTYKSTIFESSESTATTAPYFEIRYIEPRINNGVYRIKNAATGKYLTVQNGGTTAGTSIIQADNIPTVNGEPNRNQLFKITFYQTTINKRINYYTIRSMTNSALAIDGPYTTSGSVTLQDKAPSDTVTPAMTQCWGIIKNGQTYRLKNGPDTYESYLTAPTATASNQQLTTTPTAILNSEWILEPYTGEELHGVNLYNFSKNILKGDTVSYANSMYSSVIGTNGPLLYNVTECDGSATDKATIDSSGNLTAIEPGTVAVRWTYAGSPWIWISLVDIGFEENIIYTFRHTATDTLMHSASENSGAAANASLYDWTQNTSMWKIETTEQGFYKIRNDVTGYYLTAPNNNINGSNLNVGVDSGDRSLFIISRESNGTYRIQSKNQYDRAASSPLYLSVANGRVVQSSTFSREWDFKPLKMNLTLYYDEAFIERNGVNSYRDHLNSIIMEGNNANVSIANVLKERFGIKVSMNVAESTFSSYPYEHDCALVDSLDEVCSNHYAAPFLYNCDDPANQLMTQEERNADCINGLHHKCSNHMLTNMSSVPILNSQDCSILFTGFKTCGILNGECCNAVLGWASPGYNNAIVAAAEGFDYKQTTAFHEALHLIGGDDHDGTDLCVYSHSGFSPDVMAALSTCDSCTDLIHEGKFKLYHHQ